jgi:preprotein translocase subunit SecD
MKFKKILKKWQVWFLLFWILVAALSISYQFDAQGVIVNGVEVNSSASLAGMTSPSPDTRPTAREHIISINDIEITDKEHYFSIIEEIPLESILRIQTSEGEYALLKNNESVGISVANAPTSNIVKGLDLQGGTRVLLSPVEEISSSEIQDIMDVLENRLNVYGLTDLTIKSASDLEGGEYILVEIAGASQEEVRELLGSQGRFEAKIGDKIVFVGGEEDITFVCRNDGTCSRIVACNPTADGEACRFEFEISLSEKAAERHAEVTKDLKLNYTEGGSAILEKQIDFYLDGVLVDSLNIGESLRGQEATNIQISGSGFGKDKESAIQNTIDERTHLQTVLITGSLPSEIEIVKLDSISPSLGQQFINNAWLVGLIAVLSVGLVISVRYRSVKIVIPMLLSIAFEVFIILGFAALFRYNLDLAAIAGIIAAVGTGVDDLIIITDETLSKETSARSLKERIKRAFFIVFVAYATTVAAMIPLFTAGAGLLTGFALITIIGVSIGVFVTRPAFASVVRTLLE